MDFKPVFALQLADQPSSYKLYRFLQQHFHDRKQECLIMLGFSTTFARVSLVKMKLTNNSGQLAQQILKHLKSAKNNAHFYLFRFKPSENDPSTKFDTKLISHLFDDLHEEGLDYDFMDYMLLTNKSYLSFHDTGFWKRK